MTYNIISTGSKGNAVIIEDRILIDCGVSCKSLKEYIYGLALVLLTHEHGDHFNETTISRLAKERPTLRWGCCHWLVQKLLACGVSPFNLDIYAIGTINKYPGLEVKVEAFRLYHNVPNCGYKIQINGQSVIYATDTSRIDTPAPNFDLYLIEANYEEEELQERINKKLVAGADFIYENMVPDNHLSLRAASDFICANAGPNSEYVLMHQHREEQCASTAQC